MKCEKCGAELLDGDMFCGECGAKVEVKKEDDELTQALAELASAEAAVIKADQELEKAIQAKQSHIDMLRNASAMRHGNYSVILKSYDSSSKMKLLKYVKELKNIGMSEAKEIIENCPFELKGNMNENTAKKFCDEVSKDYNAICEIIESQN